MPQYLPMLIPPVPWLRNNLGGHLTLRNTVMRIRGSRMQQEMLDAADREWVEGRGPGVSKASCTGGGGCGGTHACRSAQALHRIRLQRGVVQRGCLAATMLFSRTQRTPPTHPPTHAQQVYEALDCLGTTAWSINQDVFRVVETGAAAACCLWRPAADWPSAATLLRRPAVLYALEALLAAAQPLLTQETACRARRRRSVGLGRRRVRHPAPRQPGCAARPAAGLPPAPPRPWTAALLRETPLARKWGRGEGGSCCTCALPRAGICVHRLLFANALLRTPRSARRSLFEHPQAASRHEVATRRTEIARVKKKNRELHSLRCDMEYKLAIARWVLEAGGGGGAGGVCGRAMLWGGAGGAGRLRVRASGE
jgi:hypothetical protein